MAWAAAIAAGTSMTSRRRRRRTRSRSQPIVNAAPVGAVIVFTLAYSAALTGLVQAWLTFPTTLPGAYQAGVDDTAFWPSVAATSPNAQAFLELVLVVATQGYIIPAPFNVALGKKTLAWLPLTTTPPSSPPTVATLAQVTATQWTAFFKANPTWLPPTAGGSSARLAAFIQGVDLVRPYRRPDQRDRSGDQRRRPAARPCLRLDGGRGGRHEREQRAGEPEQSARHSSRRGGGEGGITATSVTLSVPILGDVPSAPISCSRPIFRRPPPRACRLPVASTVAADLRDDVRKQFCVRNRKAGYERAEVRRPICSPATPPRRRG